MEKKLTARATRALVVSRTASSLCETRGALPSAPSGSVHDVSPVALLNQYCIPVVCETRADHPRRYVDPGPNAPSVAGCIHVVSPVTALCQYSIPFFVDVCCDHAEAMSSALGIGVVPWPRMDRVTVTARC